MGHQYSSSQTGGSLNADCLRSYLRTGDWITKEVGAQFREALIEGLSKTVQRETLTKVPTAFLASAFYRGSFADLPNEACGIVLSVFGIEVIDASVGVYSAFWNEAVREVAGPDGKLAQLEGPDVGAIQDAILKIATRLPHASDSFHFVKQIAVFESAKWAASSQPHFAGCIFINKALVRSPKLAETIIHELAHQEFFCLNLLDRVVTPEADLKMVYASFQDNDRPTIGRMHAAHSLFRTCQFHASTSSDAIVADANYLRETIGTFSAGDLTPFGQFLLTECYSRYTTGKQEGK